jgi:hypothetical protein
MVGHLRQARGDDLGCGVHRLHVLRRVIQLNQVDVDPVVALANENVAVFLIGLATDSRHRRERVTEGVAVNPRRGWVGQRPSAALNSVCAAGDTALAPPNTKALVTPDSADVR